MVFDDGWDDPQTLWQFHSGFPHGFKPLAELCRSTTRTWASGSRPSAATANRRSSGSSLAARRVTRPTPAAFRWPGRSTTPPSSDACLAMIRNYGVNHFKFDGIAAGHVCQRRPARLRARYRSHAPADAGTAAGRPEPLHQPHHRLLALALLAPLCRLASGGRAATWAWPAKAASSSSG